MRRRDADPHGEVADGEPPRAVDGLDGLDLEPLDGLSKDPLALRHHEARRRELAAEGRPTSGLDPGIAEGRASLLDHAGDFGIAEAVLADLDGGR